MVYPPTPATARGSAPGKRGLNNNNNNTNNNNNMVFCCPEVLFGLGKQPAAAAAAVVSVLTAMKAGRSEKAGKVGKMAGSSRISEDPFGTFPVSRPF